MIRARIEALRARGETALIVYLMAGFPSPLAWRDALRVAAAAGADVIEVGIPFSDPIADGPAIQRASQAALAAGTTLASVLDSLADARPPGVGLCLMSYLNPLVAFGARLVPRAREVGVHGLVVPDLPLEEAGPWLAATSAAGLELSLFVAPTTGAERARAIGARSTGFVYYVAVTGTTGARKRLGPDLPAALGRLRALTDKPIAVGFGISRPEHVAALRGRADAVVVGSRLVEALERGEDLEALIRSFKRATKES